MTDGRQLMRSWAALATTREHARLRDQALRAITRWRSECRRPVVSVSGGKDSTVLLLLAREVDPTIPALRADPPNPLPDRPEHVDALRQAAGGEWWIEPYPWDVSGVLAGDVAYPDGLKVRRLTDRMRAEGVDGVALGIRAAESAPRRRHLSSRGLVYRRADGLCVCAPLAWWSAEHVLGELLIRDALPINPVYTHLDGFPLGLEDLRDGTWWPHGRHEGRESWMQRYYPDVYPLFCSARSARWRRERAEW